MFKPLITSIVYSFLIFTYVGCSQSPPVREYLATASAPDEIGNLNADIDSAASNNQADVLSPDNFRKAVDARDDAKRDLDKKKDPKDVLHSVAVGRSYLDQANEVAGKARTQMEDVVTARKLALAAGAAGFFQGEVKDVDSDLKDVGRDLEEGNNSSAEKNRRSLQTRYLDLELKAIKQANIGEARDKIGQARKDDAEDLTPRTLAIAEKNYKDTDAFITANRHDPEVKTRSKVTLESADHLQKILRDSKMSKKTSPEEMALKLDTGQKQVASKESELSKTSADLKKTGDQLEAEQRGSVILGSENERLEKDKKFQEHFDRAQKEFSKEEAEVYKQDGALVIRLKALAFPKSKATLKDVDFALLAKVQKVIKDFGDSTVVVEGHTDSQGSQRVNEKLSDARAKAVKDYLVANEAIEPSRITAVGLGYQKPLGTNKTAGGRAQNRRVDILIKPTLSDSG